MAADLPPTLREEALNELIVYAKPRPRFLDLFYIPIWSFLHWVSAVRQGAGSNRLQPMIEQAEHAHALSLFLHLWDDHLADSQLKPNLLRLHLRAIAWQRYHAAVAALANTVEGGPEIITRLVNNYLAACHHSAPVHDLAAFSDRFVQQIGIWLVVPTLLGHIVGGPGAARDLASVIESFAVAWRLIDDVEDIDKDILSGQDNAVWFELDHNGRDLWARCRAAFAGTGRFEPQAWASMSATIRNKGALAAVLGRINELLVRAEDLAMHAGWSGLAGELAASRRLQGLDR
jgi:hypothetical protein